MSSSETRTYLAKVARLYYLEEMSQPEIARRMNVSIATVSRALRKAREMGVVRITIDESFERMGELESNLEKEWSLSECLVVPSHDRPSSTYPEIAAAMSDVLSRLIGRGCTLGISWGETLKAVGENLKTIRTQELRVIPIIGAMGMVDTGIYPNSIAREFAARLKGTPYLVNTPAMVDNRAIRDSMLLDSHYRAVREIWQKLDIAVIGVSGLNEDTSVFRQGVFSREELQALREKGGVCATNFAVLDANGASLDDPISERILGLPFEELADIRHVIVVTAGKVKAEPLRAVLSSGVVTRLVTDEECARALAGL